MKRYLVIAFLATACSAPQEPVAPPSTPAPSETASSEPASSTAEPPTATIPADAGRPKPNVPRATGAQFLPVDEAPSDATLVAFRTRMLEAVRRKDRDALLAMIDPKIRTGFDGSGGLTGFRRGWKLDAGESPLWHELDVILSNGGSFMKGVEPPLYCAPYVYSAWGDDRPDVFEYGAIIGSDVPLYESKDVNSTPLLLLDHHLVKFTGPAAGSEWREVEIDGKRGFVKADSVRSPIGYRACFSKRSGDWKMEMLVKGD